MPVACLAAVLACLASLLWGAGDIGPAQAWAVLMGQGSEEARFVVTELRAPRTVIGIAVGMMLACGGALMQVVARNPLAEPGLLGVSAGAAFAVAIALLLGMEAAGLHVLVAQAGALLGCLFVMSTV
ncbi:MAG: iron chelate uptake ABC transporter family permease subunit, partial [Cobetia marina]